MVTFRDKRAEKEALERAGAQGPVELREDGSIRRPGKGGRTFGDFFNEEHRQRSLSRADYVNIRAMECYAARENRWWRKVWRWCTRQPQVSPIEANLAAAHARSLDDLHQRLTTKIGGDAA